jgi:hypothetical protein
VSTQNVVVCENEGILGEWDQSFIQMFRIFAIAPAAPAVAGFVFACQQRVFGYTGLPFWKKNEEESGPWQHASQRPGK